MWVKICMTKLADFTVNVLVQFCPKTYEAFLIARLINSTSNDPCYRQVYLCMKIALNIHLTWCAELYIRAIVELEWVNVSENLHDKTGWLHSERFDFVQKHMNYFRSQDSYILSVRDQQSVKICYILLEISFSVYCMTWTFMKIAELLNCQSL